LDPRDTEDHLEAERWGRLAERCRRLARTISDAWTAAALERIGDEVEERATPAPRVLGKGGRS
jgi:hypothetical protein